MVEVSYYPGCSLHGIAREYNESTEAVSEKLGVNLAELEDWNCCGASSAHATSNELALALPERNLRLAGQVGMDLVVPCAACYSRLRAAEKELLADTTTEGAADKYQGGFQVKHLADFFWEDVGEDVILPEVTRPLAGLSVVCYYGCLITRPPRVTDVTDPDNPESMDNLMKTVGADVRDWSYKTDCCGAGHVLTLPRVAQQMIQKLLDMAQEAGADCIVSGCPMCQSNLDRAQEDISRETGKKYGVPILYFTELMGLAFGHPSAGKWFSRHIVDPRPLLKQKGLL
ncbi:MAG TPA: CoB--CoM heterodisulfide reductase iron-sulfur subunit B family protein [Dehalococcoidales bacterium]|nr:CoB--CoM heterodisulfide reductase iron-sulfur subunit B family protein [Dehalococcoidales bacterium]